MDYLVVCVVSLVVALLTLFSGFGLGTLLMPAFALFFPLPIAVAATAVVHLANNVFKVVLVGKNASGAVVTRFAIPAALAAVVGAALLQQLDGVAPLMSYQLADSLHHITIVKLVIAIVIIGFAVLELMPGFAKWSVDARLIPIGGLLSGFFGGLSGHQGALRTAFLLRAGLSKEAFIGTMVVSAVVVDVTRLLVYGTSFLAREGDLRSLPWGLIAAGSIAAFVGSFVGAKLVRKVTMRAIQLVVGIMLLIAGVALGAGLI